MSPFETLAFLAISSVVVAETPFFANYFNDAFKIAFRLSALIRSESIFDRGDIKLLLYND